MGLLLAAISVACSGDAAPPEVVAGAGTSGSAGTGGTGGASAGTGGVSGSGGSAIGGMGGLVTTGGTGGSGTGGNPAFDFAVDGVTTWRHDAVGAYSIIHDDVCNDSVSGVFEHAVPLADARGLQFGLGIIAGSCDNDWDWLAEAVLAGHEIVNHSWSHPNLTDNRDYAEQIDQAREIAQLELSAPVDFFIFPFDAFDQTAVDHLRNQGYLGARTGRQSVVTAPDFADAFAVGFTVFYTDHGVAGLNNYVDDAVEQGGWALRELHGVEDGSWETAPLADYTAHLDYVAEKVQAGEIWMAPPSTVLKYRFARERCGPVTRSPDPVAANQLVFGGLGPECERYATELTVSLTVPSDPAVLYAVQNGAPLSTNKIGPARFFVDVDPTLGAVSLAVE